MQENKVGIPRQKKERARLDAKNEKNVYRKKSIDAA